MNTENWKAVVGYEGLYEVSDQGNVKRVGAWTDGRKNRVRGVRKPSPSKRYSRITLFRDKTHREFAVHRLVLAAFVGPIPFGYEVNHKNGIHRDNRLENLEYVTHSDNQKHKYRILDCPTRPGSKHHAAKLTEDDAFAIRALRKRQWKLKDIAKVFGIAVPTVCWITKNKTWRHI